jgi:pimeloyl-ACP methyl ester carboxylesterase
MVDPPRMSSRRKLFLAAACAGLIFVSWKMLRIYREAQQEFHLPPAQVGPPPPGFSAVSFASGEARIAAWWAPGKRPVSLILLHGTENDRRQLLPEARVFLQAGFGVLLYDSPGLGESTGSVTWSRTEQPALRAAVQFVKAAVPSGRIGALGFSMGATILADVAGRDPGIAAVVLEAPILDKDEETNRAYGKWGQLTSFSARMGKRAGGYDPNAEKPLDTIAGLRGRPLFILCGSVDPIAPPADAERLFAAAPEPKSLWIVPGAGHGSYLQAAGEAYLQRLVSFFERAFN